MAEVAYEVKGSHDTGPSDPFHTEGLTQRMAGRIDGHDGAWKLQGPGAANTWRSHRFAKRHFAETIIAHGKLNDKYTLLNKKHPDVKVEWLVVNGLTIGQKMLDEEANHYNYPYCLGGSPYGGCADCTGWVSYLVEKYTGVKLIHQSQAMFTQLGGHVIGGVLHAGSALDGAIFPEEDRAKPGDIVFKSWPAFDTPGDTPDHAGLFVAKGTMRDTRSVNERLANRAIYDGVYGAQTMYGRIYKVNGHLPS